MNLPTKLPVGTIEHESAMEELIATFMPRIHKYIVNNV